jgi:Septum formation initiator
MPKNKNVVRLNNDYTNKQIEEQQELIKNKLPRRRYMAIILVVVILIMTILIMNLVGSYMEYQSKLSLERQYQAEKVKIMNSNKQKKEQVSKLQNDDYVAKFARSKYFYAQDGETVYNIPELVNTTK